MMKRIIFLTIILGLLPKSYVHAGTISNNVITEERAISLNVTDCIRALKESNNNRFECVVVFGNPQKYEYLPSVISDSLKQLYNGVGYDIDFQNSGFQAMNRNRKDTYVSWKFNSTGYSIEFGRYTSREDVIDTVRKTFESLNIPENGKVIDLIVQYPELTK